MVLRNASKNWELLGGFPENLGIVLEIPLNFRNGSELILLFWDILENLRNSFGNSWKIWGIALGSSQKAQRKRLRHLLTYTN